MEAIKLIEDAGIDPIYLLAGILAFFFMMIFILIILTFKMKSKTKKLSKKYEEFMKGKDGINLEEIVLKKFKEIDDLKISNEKNEDQIKSILENLLITYQKMGIIKYDAFNEMGGKLSFSLALLNKNNTGFIINSMHSREGCYSYIKEIIKGESFIALGEEEKQALEMAVKSSEYMI